MQENNNKTKVLIWKRRLKIQLAKNTPEASTKNIFQRILQTQNYKEIQGL